MGVWVMKEREIRKESEVAGFKNLARYVMVGLQRGVQLGGEVGYSCITGAGSFGVGQGRSLAETGLNEADHGNL
jgi:hypothetical protein